MSRSASTFSERALFEAKRKKLIGAALASSDQEIFIEETFPKLFATKIPNENFWKAFEKACNIMKSKENSRDESENDTKTPKTKPKVSKRQELLGDHRKFKFVTSIPNSTAVAVAAAASSGSGGSGVSNAPTALSAWAEARQVMLGCSLPQQVNAKDEKVRFFPWSVFLISVLWKTLKLLPVPVPVPVFHVRASAPIFNRKKENKNETNKRKRNGKSSF